MGDCAVEQLDQILLCDFRFVNKLKSIDCTNERQMLYKASAVFYGVSCSEIG